MKKGRSSAQYCALLRVSELKASSASLFCFLQSFQIYPLRSAPLYHMAVHQPVKCLKAHFYNPKAKYCQIANHLWNSFIFRLSHCSDPHSEEETNAIRGLGSAASSPAKSNPTSHSWSSDSLSSSPHHQAFL
jgi:hypothetical protein